MANMAAKVTAAFFDSEGIKYDLTGENQEVILTGFAMHNRPGTQRLIIHFDDDEEGVAIRAFEIAKFPEEKLDAMYKLVNTLNDRFRWIKFTVDEKDFTITAADDAVIQIDSCAQEVMQCSMQMLGIIDKAYADIMKGIFS
ncbi:MAG: YbjN domain-containing protein [Clostridiales bacterium]|nr:YbjN domain-containing protein [Clostridiales bacterium]